jgi:hypothetical protein
MTSMRNRRSMGTEQGISGRKIMLTNARMPGLLSVAAIIAAGCAPQAEVVKLYDDPARPPAAYERLLVVVVSSDFDQQQQFEHEIVDGLRREQVAASPSHASIDTSDGMLQEDIDRLSDAVGADGILISNVVSVDTRVETTEGRAEIESTCRGGDPVDVFLYDHKVIREPDSVKMAHTVTVVTSLYDTASKSRVWTIQSTCFEKASMAAVVQEEAGAIVRQLRIDELI